MLNGSPVMGSGINIHLGEDGEIISVVKIWGVYKYAGKVEVISAEKAYEKLKNYEITPKPQGTIMKGTKIKNIQLGYRLLQPGSDEKGAYLQPVWIFYATDPRDSVPFPLMVDAGKST
jgi:regulatory protein YycH of two-component signal transduction system YycFG